MDGLNQLEYDMNTNKTYIAKLNLIDGLDKLINLAGCVDLPRFDDCIVFYCTDAWLDQQARELVEEHDLGVADLMQLLDVQEVTKPTRLAELTWMFAATHPNDVLVAWTTGMEFLTEDGQRMTIHDFNFEDTWLTHIILRDSYGDNEVVIDIRRDVLGGE